MKRVSLVNILTLVAALLAPIVFSQKAEAAPNLTIAMVRLDRMQGGAVTTGTICARPTTAATEAKVIVTFPATFTVGASANWDTGVVTTGWPGSPTPTAWPSIQAQGTASGQVVTFTGGDLTVGTTYCFNWTNTAAITNPSATNNMIGYVETQTGASATIDKSAIAFSTVTSDVIVITGAVNPTFSFALPTNTDTFTSVLSNGATAETSGSAATITTNARNGWTTWVKSANAGLVSASPGASTIATVGTYDGTPTTLSSGTTGYVLKVTTSGGTSAPAAEYTTTGANDGGTLTTAYNIAAAETAPSSAETVTFTERARVATTQPPATDYTDTLTIIAAGMF